MQKTAYDMRISDWSSDVCSSDLPESRIPNPAPKRIALCAGEASGDLLGAGLIEQLRARFPDAQFAGIGGDAMRAAGFEAWHDAQVLAVMGFDEVLAHLPRLLKLRRGVRRRAVDWTPVVGREPGGESECQDVELRVGGRH